MAIFLKTFLLSVRRRKRQMRYVSLTAFIAVLFLSAVSVFQNVMNQYLMQKNYQNYGNWILSAVNEELEHPYFSLSGICRTGAEFQDEKGEVRGLHIGTADEAFLKLGEISLYEGRMPQADNEIVMNLPSLASLGYGYELGQEIQLFLCEEPQSGQEPDMGAGKREEKKFILVGTVANFAENWKSAGGYPLPDCFVTEQAFVGAGRPGYTTYFYQLDNKYNDIDTKEFTTPFLSSQENAEGTRVYNSYVYDNRVWGSPVMFRAVELILICIAMLAMGYLLISYTAKRRKWYYQMRCTGAGRRQIWKIICIEGMYGTIPCAAAALLFPYLAGALLCFIVSRIQGVPYFFAMEPVQLLLQGGAVLAAILAAIFAACISCSDKRLSGNVQEITEKQRTWLRRDIKKGKDPAKHFQKRQNRIHPYQNAALTILSVVVCGILILCINLFYEKLSAYREAVRTMDDFSANYKAEKRWDSNGKIVKDTQEYTMGATLYDMYDGMETTAEVRMDALIGIKRAEKRILDQGHSIDWEKKDQSQMMRYVKEKEKENALFVKQMTLFYYYDDYAQAAKELGKFLEDVPLDRKAFEAGEEVLLLTGCLELEADDEGNVKEVLIQDDTIKTGDMATIQSEEYPGNVSVRTVVKSIDKMWGFPLDETSRVQCFPYTVIATRALAERVGRADGKTIENNRFYIALNENTSFEATPKQLSTLFSEYGLEYTSGWEQKGILRENVVRQFGIYGSLFCMILSLYLLLLLNLNQTQNYGRAEKYRLLKRLGMSDSFFLRMMTREGLKEALKLLPGIVCGYGLLIWRSWTNWAQVWDESVQQGGITTVYSRFLGEYTDARFWNLLENVIQELKIYTNVVWSGIFLLLLMAAVAVMVIFSAMNVIKKGKGVYDI